MVNLCMVQGMKIYFGENKSTLNVLHQDLKSFFASLKKFLTGCLKILGFRSEWQVIEKHFSFLKIRSFGYHMPLN